MCLYFLIYTIFFLFYFFFQSKDDEIKDTNEYLHPRIVIVGDLLSDFYCYVILQHRKYYFENPLKAIETCFHFFCGLNINYPIECRYIWLFLERAVFKLNISDTNDSFMNILLKTLL